MLILPFSGLCEYESLRAVADFEERSGFSLERHTVRYDTGNLYAEPLSVLYPDEINVVPARHAGADLIPAAPELNCRDGFEDLPRIRLRGSRESMEKGRIGRIVRAFRKEPVGTVNK